MSYETINSLSEEAIASKRNEMAQTRKMIASTNRGRDTFKLGNERDHADSHIVYGPDSNKLEDDSYLWKGQDTAVNDKHFGCEGAIVTLHISVVSDLTKNSNMVKLLIWRAPLTNQYLF